MKKQLVSLVVFFGLILGLCSSTAWAETYKVDTSHSTVGFKVKHLISYTTGRFNKFDGTINFDPTNPQSWSAEGSIEAASIDTNNADRDNHLKNADFFEVEKHPTITFKTTKVIESTATSAKVEGVLNMHGVEKPIVLDVEILGTVKDPWGNTRAAFSAKSKINRKDFGIVYNKVLDTGGLMLGEEVELNLEIEAIAQK